MTYTPQPWRFSVGDHVAGVNAGNAGFSGTVTEITGSFSVVLDDYLFTPESLIRSIDRKAEPMPSGGVFD